VLLEDFRRFQLLLALLHHPLMVCEVVEKLSRRACRWNAFGS
jgi:hypothetical protein